MLRDDSSTELLNIRTVLSFIFETLKMDLC